MLMLSGRTAREGYATRLSDVAGAEEGRASCVIELEMPFSLRFAANGEGGTESSCGSFQWTKRGSEGVVDAGSVRPNGERKGYAARLSDAAGAEEGRDSCAIKSEKPFSSGFVASGEGGTESSCGSFRWTERGSDGVTDAGDVQPNGERDLWLDRATPEQRDSYVESKTPFSSEMGGRGERVSVREGNGPATDLARPATREERERDRGRGGREGQRWRGRGESECEGGRASVREGNGPATDLARPATREERGRQRERGNRGREMGERGGRGTGRRQILLCRRRERREGDRGRGGREGERWAGELAERGERVSVREGNGEFFPRGVRLGRLGRLDGTDPGVQSENLLCNAVDAQDLLPHRSNGRMR